MIPLDDLDRVTAKMREPGAADILTAYERAQWEQSTEKERIEALKSIIFHPVGYNLHHWFMFNWFTKTKWLEALRAVGLSAPASMVELATGAGDMLPQLMAKYYSHRETRYTSVNKNKLLTAEFKQRTKDFPLKIEVIEDAAQNADRLFDENKADIVVFEHSFNDIAEDLIARAHGMDTVNTNWFDILPKMIEITNKAYADGSYEKILKESFVQMIGSLLKISKPGSFVISYQFHYQGDIDMGINPEIWTTLVSSVRGWLREKNIGTEVFFEGFEPNWWMFLKNT